MAENARAELTIGSWNAGQLRKDLWIAKNYRHMEKMRSIVALAAQYDIFCMQEIGIIHPNNPERAAQYKQEMNKEYRRQANLPQNDKKQHIFWFACGTGRGGGTVVFVKRSDTNFQFDGVENLANRGILSEFGTVQIVRGKFADRPFSLLNVYGKNLCGNTNAWEQEFNSFLVNFIATNDIDFLAVMGDFNNVYETLCNGRLWDPYSDMRYRVKKQKFRPCEDTCNGRRIDRVLVNENLRLHLKNSSVGYQERRRAHTHFNMYLSVLSEQEREPADVGAPERLCSTISDGLESLIEEMVVQMKTMTLTEREKKDCQAHYEREAKRIQDLLATRHRHATN